MKNEVLLDEFLNSEGADAVMLQMIEAYQALQKEGKTDGQPIKTSSMQISQVDANMEDVWKKAVNDMVAQFKKEVRSELKQCLKEPLHDACVELDEVIKDARWGRQTQAKESSWLWQCIVGTAVLFFVLGGILGGLTVHYFMADVTPELQQRLNHATLIENAWPKLSQKEQDKIVSLAQGNGPTSTKVTHSHKK